MTVNAFVLIEAEVGKTGEIIHSAKKFNGVKSADLVVGPYDVVVVVEVADLDALGALVPELHSIPGTRRITTLVAV